MRIPKHLYCIGFGRDASRKSYGLISDVLEDYSTHDETCTLYTVYSVQYVVYISIKGHVMFCFDFGEISSNRRSETTFYHIKVHIYMYIFTCLCAKFCRKIFTN
jgi:hypothetical protein